MAAKAPNTIGYHGTHDYAAASYSDWWTHTPRSEFTYTFENFFHPFVGDLIEKLNKESLAGMLDPAFHANLQADFFTDFYRLRSGDLLRIEHFPKEIDVTSRGPYANYNWELLFHIPLTIAVHLSKNQRFAEAQRWFHFIFDPTAYDPSVAVPQRYWKFIAFRKGSAGKQMDEQLALLSKPAAECDSTELSLKEEIL